MEDLNKYYSRTRVLMVETLENLLREANFFFETYFPIYLHIAESGSKEEFSKIERLFTPIILWKGYECTPFLNFPIRLSRKQFMKHSLIQFIFLFYCSSKINEDNKLLEKNLIADGSQAFIEWLRPEYPKFYNFFKEHASCSMCEALKDLEFADFIELCKK